MIMQTYSTYSWQTLGKTGEDSQAFTYQCTSFIEQVLNSQMRLLVLESMLASKVEVLLMKESERLKLSICALERHIGY